MTFLEIVGTIFIALGGLTMLVGALGVVRFPDFYTRLHAAGKGDTLGQALVLFGLLFVAGFSFDAFKLCVIIFFVLILNSTATHGLARAGWLAGLRPWVRTDAPGTPQFEGQLDEDGRQATIRPVPTAPDSVMGDLAVAESDEHHPGDAETVEEGDA